MSESVADLTCVDLPGMRVYPERTDIEMGWQRAVSGGALKTTGQLLGPYRRLMTKRFVASVNDLQASLALLDTAGFTRFVECLRADIIRLGLQEECVVRSFAVVREAARRTIGLVHYSVQLQAGYVMLQERVAELETGEGKTLTATLTAATAAFSGVSVHVITVNDYLARRDRDLMAPVYEALGLTVGLVVSDMSGEERRRAYRANITYCTNKEVAFDYLRDRMALENRNSTLRIKLSRLFKSSATGSEPVMRGLQFAIVDEADSILIDEARTPLIISERTDPAAEQKTAEESLAIVDSFLEGEHYSYRGEHRQIVLSAKAEAELQERSQKLQGPWKGKLFREEQARNALSALNVFLRDQHYLVRDDKVEIIDENTGRVMPDRSWGDGIHQMIEAKESCTVTGQTIPLAQMTYQRFFRRYQKLAGMTGTAHEAKAELWSVYRLPVARINTHRPLARVYNKPELFSTAELKWQRIVERTKELTNAGVPVLIGTRSVSSSEMASQYLRDGCVDHCVLNAAQDQHEAEIIAQAGSPGQVTVATNMAGRGVDISLSPEILKLGGLHVIMSEMHDSKRIDRQLFGRCARQGEPGYVEIYLSLEDSLITDSGLTPGVLNGILMPRVSMFTRAQKKVERRHRHIRRDLMRWDDRSGTALSFAGSQE